MKSVKIKNISLTAHGTQGRSHIHFVDQHLNSRLGRILPPDINIEHLKDLYCLVSGLEGIILPDGISELPDGSSCLSVISSFPAPLIGDQHLSELIKPIRNLHQSGMRHLSIDEYSYTSIKGNIHLIFWGDGLLDLHPGVPCELQSGGIPEEVSDLYMLASTALRMNWLSDLSDQKDAEALSSNSVLERWETAKKYNYQSPVSLDLPSLIPKPGVNIIQGGSSTNRDLFINQLSAIAVDKGWICRIIRCATGELGRPLPDVPLGTVTESPGDLLQNSFAERGGIEKLLIINDFSEKQEDFSSLIQDIAKLIPSGLRLVLCGSSIPEHFRGNRISLHGSISEAADIPLHNLPDGTRVHSPGPSWYGPRCRIPMETATGIVEPSISSETLFQEGAWRHTAALPFRERKNSRAESFFNLGRYAEALQCVPEKNSSLRAKILMSLGRFEEAVNILSEENEAILLSEAFLGTGDIPRALAVIKQISDPNVLPLLAKLHNLSGSPSTALIPLRKGLETAPGGNKVEIFCALRSLEMRLGMYEEALKHAEEAVALARRLADIPLLVKSLQERGRTLQVSGNWNSALEDFRTAVQYHDEGMLSFARPPHIDLYVLQLKMGRMHLAEETRKKFAVILETAGILSMQMQNMLEAYRGVLLGRGESSLPEALRAAELADIHGLELYSGISTLYAGQLYIQAGERKRGIDLLRRARSRGHVLGDKHLVCLSEIELLLENESHTSTGSGINGIAVELPEEQAAVNIISGTNIEESFELLLDLPSPLMACRLADTCGFPEKNELKKRILESRDEITKQLEDEDRESYTRLFKSTWNQSSATKFNAQVTSKFLGKISNWIQEYLEGESTLLSLSESLHLDEISLHEKPHMHTVPGNNPLYCSGSGSKEVAPFLEPVAAVLATKPADSKTATKIDTLSSLIVGNSKKMKKIRFELERVAVENVPVLITGETGTGKELCAKAIHSESMRKQSNFVPVDCGAIPENLMESEFFGAGVGAYTGISNARKGLLEEADEGTLFLDEIGNLPLHMQAKLLRVLDTGVFRRLGETRERSTDLRLVAATNSHIETQIRESSFRTDLYYRISVVRIDLPPLRDRLEDIPQLVPIFTEKKISSGALDLLSSYRWPGNIRELSNVLRRASIASTGNLIQRSHVSFNTVSPLQRETCTLHEAIRLHVKNTVESFGGNRKKAAKALKCDPKTLRKYLTEKGM